MLISTPFVDLRPGEMTFEWPRGCWLRRKANCKGKCITRLGSVFLLSLKVECSQYAIKLPEAPCSTQSERTSYFLLRRLSRSGEFVLQIIFCCSSHENPAKQLDGLTPARSKQVAKELPSTLMILELLLPVCNGKRARVLPVSTNGSFRLSAYGQASHNLTSPKGRTL